MPPRNCRCGGAGWDGCPPEDRGAIRADAAFHQQIEVDLLAEIETRPYFQPAVESQLLDAMKTSGEATLPRILPAMRGASELPPHPPIPTQQRRSLRPAERRHK